MRALLFSLVLSLAIAPALAQDDAPVEDEGLLSSHIDFTVPENRDLPVRCKKGDVEYFAGKTVREVFGDAWPEAPVATHVERARLLQAAPPVWPHGLGQHGAVVVTAVLVGPNGRAIASRPLCASAPVIANPVVKADMRSRFQPATFDGVPGTSVTVRVARFLVREGERPTHSRSR